MGLTPDIAAFDNCNQLVNCVFVGCGCKAAAANGYNFFDETDFFEPLPGKLSLMIESNDFAVRLGLA